MSSVAVSTPSAATAYVAWYVVTTTGSFGGVTASEAIDIDAASAGHTMPTATTTTSRP